MENEEDKDGAGALCERHNKRVLYRLLPFLFILLFLVAGGYFALNTMRQSAHELGGGSEYKKLSANHAIYEGNAALPKESNYFSSSESLSSAQDGDPAVDRMKLSARPGMEADGSAPVFSNAAEGGSGEYFAGAQGAGPAPQSAPTRTAMASRMQVKSSSFRSSGGSAAKSVTLAQPAAFQGGGPRAGTAAVQREVQGAAPKKGGGAGVIDSLKGAFRASIYGARIASQDSAKSWIAQTFDATPEPRDTIQYEDKVKASLDVVNPNSIPKFLRDQEVSVSAAGTLTASKVSNPALVKDKEEEEDSGAADAAKSVFSGAFNSMFSGFDLTGSESAPATAPETREETPPDGSGGDGLSAQSSDQDLVSVDEFGFISYGDPNGFQYVFDPDGNLMGCTDNAAGFSIPAGNSGCP